MNFFWRDHLSAFPFAPLTFHEATQFDGLPDEGEVTVDFVVCLNGYDGFVLDLVAALVQSEHGDDDDSAEGEARQLLTMRMLELWTVPLHARLREPKLQMYLFNVFVQMEQLGWSELTDDVIRNYCATLANAMDLFHDNSSALEALDILEALDQADDGF